MHHEEENTTELEVDQKFYVLITKITRNNYLLVKQLPTCSEGAEAFLVIGFQYELCFRIPKFFILYFTTSEELIHEPTFTF